jgi:hypothetical protein
MATEIQWVPVAASLVGGGAVGAVITAIVTTMRNRRQPIGKRVDIIRLFKDGLGNPSLTTRITVSDGCSDHNYTNLFIAELLIANRGNQDIPAFRFGVTLLEGDQAIYVQPQTADRHHELTVITPVCPDTPRSEIDFEARPLNRGDSYPIRLYITMPDGKGGPTPIRFSSSHPIKFVEMPTVTETLAEIASSTSLSIGPLALSLRRSR